MADRIYKIKNVKIYKPSGSFEAGELFIQKDRIAEVMYCTESAQQRERYSEEEQIDGKGTYVMPGFIDMHFHGCNGYDFCDSTLEALSGIAKYEAAIGVTAVCPASMTLPVDQLEQILTTAAQYRKKQRTVPVSIEADYVGVNMEGPFISKEKRGAQDAAHIIPCDVNVAKRFLTVSEGLVKLIGIAPDAGGTGEFISQLKDQVHVSLAHTNASYKTAKEAFDAGADHIVHLYNAMPPFLHREPGVVGAAADSMQVTAELICDGIHVHPAVVRATFHMLGAERIILISDSMRATGLSDGRYTLGGQEVTVQGKYARLISDGTIAGSVTSLPDCVRILVKEIGIPLETAVMCATVNPAKKLGIYAQYGSIEAGKKANLVFWNEDLGTEAVMKDGVFISEFMIKH